MNLDLIGMNYTGGLGYYVRRNFVMYTANKMKKGTFDWICILDKGDTEFCWETLLDICFQTIEVKMGKEY
jgi:hypothetical protein